MDNSQIESEAVNRPSAAGRIGVLELPSVKLLSAAELNLDVVLRRERGTTDQRADLQYSGL